MNTNTWTPGERVKNLPQLREELKTPGLSETMLLCIKSIFRALVNGDKPKAERIEGYLKTHQEK